MIASSVSNTFSDPVLGHRLLPLSLLVFFAGAAFAVVRPARGVQDWLAGTWIVPR